MSWANKKRKEKRFFCCFPFSFSIPIFSLRSRVFLLKSVKLDSVIDVKEYCMSKWRSRWWWRWDKAQAFYCLRGIINDNNKNKHKMNLTMVSLYYFSSRFFLKHFKSSFLHLVNSSFFSWINFIFHFV